MNRLIGSLFFVFMPVSAMASGATGAPDSPANEHQQGRNIYEQYCATCHGWQGEGAAAWKKPDEKGEMPAPPHDASGHTWRHSDAMLFKMIAEGWRHPFNQSDRLTMPAFKNILTDQEIGLVIDYLRTLWSEEQRIYQQRESQEVPNTEQRLKQPALQPEVEG